ncbi:hypothetical protein ADK86_35470 [Streptomyces sp. NRRL F-5755]|uniref:hypothetical protein n=1 Tax=Streptomyces sp. NRRL F-5755 TaxID=1519475 RepID=UPI0006AEFB47|nr:hypothetical protein [Streptomyces sp. NRRL F-5755]KOT87555.1 hypothetical protein ADK86_35470 [Streptomyces sp. NRRL F-5755]
MVATGGRSGGVRLTQFADKGRVGADAFLTDLGTKGLGESRQWTPFRRDFTAGARPLKVANVDQPLDGADKHLRPWSGGQAPYLPGPLELTAARRSPADRRGATRPRPAT